MRMTEVAAQQNEPLRSRLEKLFCHFPADAEVMVRQYKKGSWLIREGDPNVLVFVLLNGYLTTAWDQPGQSQYRLANSKPLTFIGDLAALAGFKEYTTSVYAKRSSTLISIPTSVFLDWLCRDPTAYRTLVQAYFKMLLGQNRFNRSSAGRTSYHRILDFLHWCYMDQADSQEEFVRIQLTRENMMDEIGGISLRSLNRYLAQIHAQGLISIKKGKVQITQEQHEKIVEIIGF